MSADPILWNDTELTTGLDGTDEQHRVLVDSVNRLIENPGTDRDTSLENLRLILTYARYHFAAEEEMLVRTGFPDLENHHHEHDRFLSTLAGFDHKFRNGKKEIDGNIIGFLRDWTIHHIQNEDRGFAAWMNENGMTSRAGETVMRSRAPFVNTDEVRGVTGIKAVDDQHVEMLRMLNWVRSFNAVPEHKRSWTANRIRVLYFYTRYHFLYEETIQRRSGFPLVSEHKIQHEELLTRAREFIAEFATGREDLAEGILNFYRAWTLQHILVEDSRIKGLPALLSGRSG